VVNGGGHVCVNGGLRHLRHQHLGGVAHLPLHLLQHGVHLGHVGVAVGRLGGRGRLLVGVGVGVTVVGVRVGVGVVGVDVGVGVAVGDDVFRGGGGGSRGSVGVGQGLVVVGDGLLHQDVGVVGRVFSRLCRRRGRGCGFAGGEDASAGLGVGVWDAGAGDGLGEVALVLGHEGLHQVRLEGAVASLHEFHQLSHRA